MKRSLLFALLFPLVAFRHSEAATTAWQSNAHGSVRLISSWTESGELLLGVQFKPAVNWYLYWKVAGEAGYPPSVEWKGSRGIREPELLWPAPKHIVLPGPIEEYGYMGEVVYPVRVKLSGDKVHIQARVSYLTCFTSCVPYRYTFSLDIPSSKVSDRGSQEGALLATYLAQVPPAGTPDEKIMQAAPTVRIFPGKDFSNPKHQSLLWILLLAWVGGVLLNVMPCVLPVLSIKLAGLLKHSGQSSSYVVKSSLASAAGILVSFEILALVAILAKSAGHAVGWGIQFQNPIFVTFLMVIVLFFALNLWGVFEIQMPRFLGHFATSFGYHETLAAHFVSGLFATLLATPCSAPFLGTAMGFALSQEPLVIVLAFAAVGTGMGLPYLALAAFPSSVRWLPKPGAWMITLKKGLAVLLLVTAAWLGWVLYRQHYAHREVAAMQSGWIAFDEAAIAGYEKEGRPVFVDATADWCVTCKYNERYVLKDGRVMAEFAKQHMVLMKADWTNRSGVIAAYLMKYGRAGIPFYAYYRPGQDPKLLSEFLTVSEVLDVLQN